MNSTRGERGLATSFVARFSWRSRRVTSARERVSENAGHDSFADVGLRFAAVDKFALVIAVARFACPEQRACDADRCG